MCGGRCVGRGGAGNDFVQVTILQLCGGGPESRIQEKVSQRLAIPCPTPPPPIFQTFLRLCIHFMIVHTPPFF